MARFARAISGGSGQYVHTLVNSWDASSLQISSHSAASGGEPAIDTNYCRSSPDDFDWNTNRGDWNRVELSLQANDIGSSNGVCRLWINGALFAEEIDIRVRNAEDEHFDFFYVGGNYSGVDGDEYPNTLWIDDVCIAEDDSARGPGGACSE